jgi:16S rRNA (guanine966-N2)-methyltransferase
MRILAGIYKGLSIKTSHKSNYRPTKALVRKSIFDTLGNLDGCRVLDLFAGTGILGFEALSRGAAQVIMIEKDPYYIKQLHANVNLFDHDKIVIKKTDAHLYLEQSEYMDIIICDPPYGKTDLNLLVKKCMTKLTKGGTIVLESGIDDKTPIAEKIKIFGQTKISYWSKN